MKNYFPIALNTKFKNIVKKLSKLNPSQNPVNHKLLIRKHGLNEKIYLDQFSKLMNK